jgi:Mandelate racemase / muconate lactonizing enzyme, N-terminal domain
MFDELTIDSIAARAVLVPMPRPLRTAAGDVPAAPLVLVDIQTSQGIVGRSYAFAYTPLMLHTLVQFLGDVAPALVGQPVSPRERMRQLDAQLKLMGMQGVVGMAIGALDQALGCSWTGGRSPRSSPARRRGAAAHRLRQLRAGRHQDRPPLTRGVGWFPSRPGRTGGSRAEWPTPLPPKPAIWQWST